MDQTKPRIQKIYNLKCLFCCHFLWNFIFEFEKCHRKTTRNSGNSIKNLRILHVASNL